MAQMVLRSVWGWVLWSASLFLGPGHSGALCFLALPHERPEKNVLDRIFEI